MVEHTRLRHGLLLRSGIVLLTVALFGCDHATKAAARAALGGGRVVPIFDGVVELRYAANDDTAFSLLRALGLARTPGLLVALSLAALAGVVVAWGAATRKGATTMHHAGFALVVAGALGNVVDRAARGYVVDFIHVARWPVFNVADVAICAGALALIVARARSAPSRARP